MPVTFRRTLVGLFSRGRVATRAAMALLVLALCACLLGGCAASPQKPAEKASSAPGTIVCTLFPQYDFAREITGSAHVSMLLKPGIESHSYEPTPGDIAKINRADVFIYTGDTMEPWVKQILNSIDSDVLVIDTSKGIELHYEEDGHGHGHDHEGHNHEDEESGYDPHVWLDLHNAQTMVDTIATELGGAYTAQAATYRNRAAAYNEKLEALDGKYAAMIKDAKRHTLAFGGPFAYLYFIEHYDLDYVSAYDSCSEEGEPSLKDISDVITYIDKNHIPVIYYDPYENNAIAESIAAQCDIKLLPFATGEFLSKEELAGQVTFLSLMETNYDSVEKGLNGL